MEALSDPIRRRYSSFLSLKLFNFYRFSWSTNAQINSVENSQLKIIIFFNFQHLRPAHTWLDQLFNGIDGPAPLHGCSLKIKYSSHPEISKMWSACMLLHIVKLTKIYLQFNPEF